MIRMYAEEGLSLAEVARRVGRSRQRLHYWLVRAAYSNFNGQTRNAGVRISIRYAREAGFELIRVG